MEILGRDRSEIFLRGQQRTLSLRLAQRGLAEFEPAVPSWVKALLPFEPAAEVLAITRGPTVNSVILGAAGFG